MGTDIHGILQGRNDVDHSWHTLDVMEDSRNYRLFAMLANVRNGFGFAGVPTHTPYVPISEPRGLPGDLEVGPNFEVSLGPFIGSLYLGHPTTHWLGDHSHSWLTVDEILSHPHWDTPVFCTGVISREKFEQWKGGVPESWCGAIPGLDVGVTAAVYEPGDKIPINCAHVRIQWERTPRQECPLFFKWLDYMQAKHAWGGELRIVFGFDN